jgi:hypothetical protein
MDEQIILLASDVESSPDDGLFSMALDDIVTQLSL